MQTPFRILGTTAMVVLLAACGGGGDSGNSGFVPPTSDFNALAGWQNLLGTGGTWTVTGTGSDNASYEATLAIAPAAAAEFPPNSTSYARTNILATLKQNGASLGTSVVEYFRAADFRLQAVRSTPSGFPSQCAVATASALPASAAKVNASGALATLNELNTCSAGETTSAGTTTSTWSIEFERSFVFLCLNSESRDAINQLTGRENDCLEIAENGTLGTKARVTLFLVGNPNFSLVAKNF